MKHFIISLLSIFICMNTYGQKQNFNYKFDITEYNVIDSLILERIYIYSPFDYESDKVINEGDGYYMIEMPHKSKMIIKTNSDRTKAIVVYNGFVFGRHKVFNIKETEKRFVLWYEDEKDSLFCGYIYDKTYKVCKYFENPNREEANRLREHFKRIGIKSKFLRREWHFRDTKRWTIN